MTRTLVSKSPAEREAGPIRTAVMFVRAVLRRFHVDDATFLAGGVAFNVLLAGVPFVLLLAAGLGFLLRRSPDTVAPAVQGALANLFPSNSATGGSILDPVLAEIVRTRTVVGLGGALSFAWFASQLFGTLRNVLAFVFMHGKERSFVHGKLIDINLVLLSLLLVVLWVSTTTWLAVTSGQVGATLAGQGVLEGTTSTVVYTAGRVLSLAVVFGSFAALYRFLPLRSIPWQPIVAGSATATVMFEVARALFAAFFLQSAPASLYTGTLGAIFTVIFWTYYAALIFIVGAEVAHVTELRLIEAGRLPPRSELLVDRSTTLETNLSAIMEQARQRRSGVRR
ncbi:MAG: tRNA-processing ribonuclease [Gemmatimonadota bacterium]